MNLDIKGEKIFVCPVPGREADVARLRDLIEGMGGVIVCKHLAEPEKTEDCVDAADVVVIPLCQESLADPRVTALADAASRAGKRVVGIWIDDAEEEVPPFLGRVGSAAVPCVGEKIRRAIFGQEPVWETPSGKPRPPQQLPRKQKC